MIGLVFGRPKPASSPRTPRPTTRLRVESLEDRWVPATLFVDDDGTAKYQTIQAAVNAASPGDTIRVAPGNYVEQVTVPADKDDLRIISTRSRGAVITAPTGATGLKAVVQIAGADDVTLRGFVITGPGTADYGVAVTADGSATVIDNLITGIRRNPFDGVQTGIGVFVSAGDATISGNTLADYQKGGIVVNGPDSSATILDNTVVGKGLTPVIAQNGIQVSGGADAVIAGNRVTNHRYDGTSAVAVGILVIDAGSVVVTDNKSAGNEIGVLVQNTTGVAVLGNTTTGNTRSGIELVAADGSTVLGNRADDNLGYGIVLEDTKNAVVLLNQARRNGQYGIAVAGASAKNLITLNQARNNGLFDLFDGTTGDGTAKTANTWAGNQFKTATPAGLG